MADDKVEVQFGAKIDELVSGMQDMSASVQDQLGKINDSLKEMSEQSQKNAEAIKVADDSIKASNESVVASFKSFQDEATKAFDRVQAGVSKITGVFEGLAALLGGGALFKGVIDSTTKWNTEVDKLSRTLGINMRDASDLNVALRLVGSDADTYTSALNKLERQLRSNEETLKSWGMATRDSNNELVNGEQAMQNAVAMILQYKQGLDQGFASQVAFGRGNEQIAPLLRLNDEIMAHAIQTAKLFGLEVGTENVAAMRKYQSEVNESKLVLEKLEEMIGNEVMKALRELASFMNDQGVSAIGAFEGALKGLEQFLDGVHLQAISARMALQDLAALPGAILAGEAGGAAFAELLKAHEEQWQKLKTAFDNKYQTPDMIGPPAPAGANAENKGLDQVGGTTTKGKSASGTGANTGLDLAAAQEELNQLKDSYQNWYTWSSTRKGDFWAEKLKQTKTGSAEAVAVYDKMMAAYKQWAADSKKTDSGGSGAQDLVTQYAEELEKVKNSQENLYTWSAQKEYEFWNTKLAAMRQGSAEAQEVWNKMADLSRSMAAQQQQAAEKAARDQIATGKFVADMQKSDAETAMKIDREKLNMRVSLGEISNQERLTQEMALYDKEYTAALTAQYKELADIQSHGNATIAEQAKVYDQIEKLQNEHSLKMQQTQDQYLAAEKKQWDGYADQVGSAMTSMLFHHQTMLQTMQQLTQKAIGFIIDSLGPEKADQWIVGERERRPRPSRKLPRRRPRRQRAPRRECSRRW